MSTNCSVIDELLSPYLDGELGEDAAQSVETHLDACARCRDELAALRRTVAAIADLPHEATPDRDLWPGIAGATEGDHTGVIPIQEQRRRQRFARPLLWAAALASLMIPAGATVMVRAFDDDRSAAPAAPRAGERVEVVIPEISIPEIRIPGFDLGQPEAIAIRALIPLMDHPQEQIRAEVAKALGEFDDPDVIAALVDALETDESPNVRRWAAWALGEIGNPAATDALAVALENDEYAEARRWAAWALGEIAVPSPGALDALSTALEEDPSPETRRWSAWALGEIQHPAAVDALNAAVVSDAMPEVRRWSAWALGEIADVRAVSSLIRALERDQVGEVRQWSAWALGEVGDARAHEALTAATRDSDSEVSAFAIRALLHLRHEVEHQIEHER